MSSSIRKFFGILEAEEGKTMSVTLKIRELREEAQLTQSELARKLSTSQRNVSNWETGASEPDLATVCAIADVFDVSLDELFGREGVIPQAEQMAGLDRLLVKKVRALTDGQKAALLSFLNSFFAQ